MLLECPNCNVIWGMEEIDAQYCGACGYPDNQEDDDDDYDDDYELTDDYFNPLIND